MCNTVDSPQLNEDFSVNKLPEVFRIEPASSCNLNCIHCPTGLRKNKSLGVMSEEIFYKVFLILQEAKPRVVVMYHGGEPLINMHTFKWIKEIKKIGIGFVKIVSNGMLLNHEKAIQMIDSGLDCIEFSLDGNSAEENNFIRKGCDYSLVIKNIKGLISLKKETCSDVPKIFITCTHFMDDNHFESESELEIPSFIKREFNGEFDQEVEYKNNFAYFWPGLRRSEGEKIYEIEKTLRNNDMVSTYCPHIVETISIRWNGDVVPCCYDLTSNYVIGSVLESTIEDIWNNNKFKKLRKSIFDKKYVSLCQNCHVLSPTHFLAVSQ